MIGSQPNAPQEAWWEQEDPHGTLIATADDLRSWDETRRIAYRVWDDLFEGRSLYSIDNAEALAAIGRAGTLSVRMLNFARSAVEHVHSKLTAEVPTCRAGSHGAKAGQRLRARRLSQFIVGAHDDMDLDGLVSTSVLTGLRTGDGVLKVETLGGRICVRAYSPREFYVDIDDARHGDPRALYHISPVDRRALAAEFPDHAYECLNAPTTVDPNVSVYDPWHAGAGVSDAVDRYEAWVLPQGDEPGRHVVASQNALLLDEEWDCERFPVAFFRPSDPRPDGGFWGIGLLERLDGIQYEIDDLIWHIGRSIRENNLKIFIPDSADISPEVIADPTVGTIIKTATGAVPEFVTPNAVSQQEIEWLQQLVNWLYQLVGMSQQGAQSTVPAGISSGRAQLFYHAFQSQSYVDMMKRVGRHVQDVIERILDAAHRLSEDDPSWTVRYAKGSIVRDIDWADVQMDRDQYVIELEDVSPVPDTFAGRMQQLEQDAAEGRVSPEWFAQLRQDPDLWDRRFQSARADADWVDVTVDALLDPSQPMPSLPDEAPRQLLLDALRTEILCALAAGDDPAAIGRLQRYASMVAQDMAAGQQQPGIGTPQGVLMGPNAGPLVGGPSGGGGGGAPPPSAPPGA